jgi:hypothetical protein
MMRITMRRMAPSPMAPYVMRLELSPPELAELEVSASTADEDESVEGVEVPAVESVELVADVEALLLLPVEEVVVELHESAASDQAVGQTQQQQAAAQGGGGTYSSRSGRP